MRSVKDTVRSNGEPYEKLENSGEKEVVSMMTEQDKGWQEQH